MNASWRKNSYVYAVVVLVVGQLVLMLGSWLYSAAYPVSGVRSLLSSEGLRWFLGRFASMQATPVLSWLLLLSIGFGVMRSALGLASAPSDSPSSPVLGSYRRRRALGLASVLLLIYIGVIALLSFRPHAVLLSATGSLWPSPFSSSLVPLVAFGLLLFGVAYGVIVGRFSSFRAVVESSLSGIRSAAPLFLIYVLLIQFYESLRFVLT